jgi:hypothetical protein
MLPRRRYDELVDRSLCPDSESMLVQRHASSEACQFRGMPARNGPLGIDSKPSFTPSVPFTSTRGKLSFPQEVEANTAKTLLRWCSNGDRECLCPGSRARDFRRRSFKRQLVV